MNIIRQHTNNKGFLKYFLNTSWLFAEKFVALPVNLVVSIYITRYLGPEKLGLLSYAQSFVNIFCIIALLGIDQIVIRDLITKSYDKDKILGTSFVIRIAGALVLLLLTVIFSVALNNTYESTLLIFLISISYLLQAFFVADLFFQSQAIGKFSAIVRTITLLMVGAIKLCIVYFQFSLYALAAVTIIESLILAWGYLWFYKKLNFRIRNWTFSQTIFKSLIKTALPVTLSSLAINIQSYIDQVMLGKMVGNLELGQYAIAIGLINIFGFLPMVIISSVAPAIAGRKKSSLIDYKNGLLNIYRLMFILFIITAIPLFFLAEYIVVLFYGNEFRHAGYLLALCGLRLFFMNFGTAKSLFITNEDLFNFSLLAAIAGTFVNILLNFILIPYYQAVGSIVATIISFMVITFLLDFFNKKTYWNFKLMTRGIFTFYKIKLIT